MFEKPLVGDRLGDALIALLDRINEYRPYKDENLEEFVAYLDDQDYTDFRDCPDHALAALHFSEKYELRELWTDAFAHCAGMNEDLVSSPEFEVRTLPLSIPFPAYNATVYITNIESLDHQIELGNGP